MKATCTCVHVWAHFCLSVCLSLSACLAILPHVVPLQCPVSSSPPPTYGFTPAPCRCLRTSTPSFHADQPGGSRIAAVPKRASVKFSDSVTRRPSVQTAPASDSRITSLVPMHSADCASRRGSFYQALETSGNCIQDMSMYVRTHVDGHACMCHVRM